MLAKFDMSVSDSLLEDIPHKLQQLAAFGKSQSLGHSIRNQLNGLSLALQTLQLQSELNLPVDQALLALTFEQWDAFLTLRSGYDLPD